MFLKLAADPEKQLASIEYWIMGSLNGVSKDSLAIPFFVTCAGFIIMTLLYRQILILSINEDEPDLSVLLDLLHLTLPDYSQDAMTDSHTYQADWLVPSS